MTNPSQRLRRCAATLGGAGLLPAPGTAGSAVAAAILFVALYFAGPRRLPQWTIELSGTLLFSLASLVVGRWASLDFGDEDPGPFVLDEAAGIFLTMLALPPQSGARLAWAIVSAFLAFRLFDITKPPPARQLERLGGAWGILCDDLAAAVYANILCQILWRTLI